MNPERKSDAEYGLNVEKPYHRNRLSSLQSLQILLVFFCISVCFLFVQQSIYRNAAQRYEIAVSAMQVSVENSVSASIAEEEILNAPVNINTADVQELCRIKGIGEAKAIAIIDYRINNGPFTYKEELMKVSGIGEKLYASIASQIILSDEEITTE